MTPIIGCPNSNHMLSWIGTTGDLHHIQSKKILISDYSVTRLMKSISCTCHTCTCSCPSIVSLIILCSIIHSCLSHAIAYYKPYAYLPDGHCPFSVWPTSWKTCTILVCPTAVSTLSGPLVKGAPVLLVTSYVVPKHEGLLLSSLHWS